MASLARFFTPKEFFDLLEKRVDKQRAFACYAVVKWQDNEGWGHQYETPTFYLLANVQGMMDENDAQRVAWNVIDPARMLRQKISGRPSEVHFVIVETWL